MEEIDNLKLLLQQNHIENLPNCGFISAALDKLISLDKENKKLRFMIENGLGHEDMQQDRMQSHIN